jgi:enoyl-CoA hydratase/carnithine racemase
MGMILTAKPISAQQALEWGLVNEVVPMKDLMATAEKWANLILECGPLSIRASKESVMKGLEMKVLDAMKAQFPAVNALWTSEDLIEGPLAFAQKRPPKWKGK